MGYDLTRKQILKAISDFEKGITPRTKYRKMKRIESVSKTCLTCKKEKELSSFGGELESGHYVLSNHCKTCKNIIPDKILKSRKPSNSTKINRNNDIDYKELFAKNNVSYEEYSKNKTTGYIYFIGSLEYKFVKIGYSKNPEKRLLELQTSCPFKIYLFFKESGSVTDERRLQKIYKKHHSIYEWYKIKGNLQKDILLKINNKILPNFLKY
jgi:Meiotically up-regulated gene 113